MTDFTDFGNDKTVDVLNAMTIAQVVASIGEPKEYVTYAEAAAGQGGPLWKQGDGRPKHASEDPAVMQAIGRCAASRRTTDKGVAFVVPIGAHRSECKWCRYSLDELLRACAWAVFASRFVTSNVLEWADDQGRKYSRSGPRTGYQNPEVRRFWELEPKERERRIELVTGRADLIRQKEEETR